jgi:type IV secretion system protein VirB10
MNEAPVPNTIAPQTPLEPEAQTGPTPDTDGIPSLAAPARAPISRKGALAVVLLCGTVLTTASVSLHNYFAGETKTDVDGKAIGDRPSAALAEPRKLDLSAMSAPRAAAGASAAVSAPRIPALVPTEEELAEPIGVRRTGTALGQDSPGHGSAKTLPPEDAPTMLVSTRPTVPRPASPSHEPSWPPPLSGPSQQDEGTAPADPLAATSRNLQAYQRQLQGLLDDLTKTDALRNAAPPGLASSPPQADSPPPPSSHTASPPRTGGLFGGQLQASETTKVLARPPNQRSLTLSKGTAFTCALKTRVISANSGLVGCQVQRTIYGDDGRVALIERGSHLDGEYRIVSVRPGTVRIPVLWTRIRTPLGVTVELDSPGTGQLGESGIDAHVDNRWRERIGAALLLSLIDDSVKLVIQSQANESRGDTIVLPSTTANTSRLAEKVLDSTINIPPLLYQNQGGIVGIYVARDVDFSAVYELRPVDR